MTYDAGGPADQSIDSDQRRLDRIVITTLYLRRGQRPDRDRQRRSARLSSSDLTTRVVHVQRRRAGRQSQTYNDAAAATNTYTYDADGQLTTRRARSATRTPTTLNGNRNSTGYTTGAGNEMTQFAGRHLYLRQRRQHDHRDDRRAARRPIRTTMRTG